MASILNFIGRFFDGYTSAISLAYADEQSPHGTMSEEELQRAQERMALAPWWF